MKDFKATKPAFQNLGNWTNGTIGEFRFSIKHFEEGSIYGINEGKISKLWIAKNGKTAVNYDRGWDIEPTDEDVIDLYNALLNEYN